jgi:hypothetical protein
MDPTASTTPILVARMARAPTYLVYALVVALALNVVIGWLTACIVELRVSRAAAHRAGPQVT